MRNSWGLHSHGFTLSSTGVSFDNIKLIVKISQWPAGNNIKCNIVFFLSPLGSWKYTVEDYKVNTKFGVCCVHSSPSQCRGLVIVDVELRRGEKMLLEEVMLLVLAPAFPVKVTSA